MLNKKTKQEINNGGSLVSSIEKGLINFTKENAEQIFEQVFEDWHEGLAKGRELIDVLGISWDDYSVSISDDFDHYVTIMKYVKKNKIPLASSIDKSGNIIESEVLIEMANFKEKTTGIPLSLWVSPKNANHGARIKVVWGDDISQSLSVSIHRENPSVVAGNEKDISAYLLKQVQQWVKLNYDILMKYWRLEVDTKELKQSLQKLSDPKGMTEDNDPDDLFHASNLGAKTTGISGLKYVWIFVKIVDHGPRIKAQWGKDYEDSVEFTVHKSNPNIISGDENKLSNDLIKQIKQWIILNYDILLDHWNDYIDSSEAIDKLKKLPTKSSNIIESGDKEFDEAIKLSEGVLDENFHVCLVCNGTGKKHDGNMCPMCTVDWKSARITSPEECMIDGGNMDNISNFFGFDKGWDL
jgi:hypothetical protein